MLRLRVFGSSKLSRIESRLWKSDQGDTISNKAKSAARKYMSSKTGASLGIIKIIPFENANEFASLPYF